MAILHVYVDDATSARLAAIAREEGRSQTALAEAAVSEAALNYFRFRRVDPGASPSEQPKERT